MATEIPKQVETIPTSCTFLNLPTHPDTDLTVFIPGEHYIAGSDITSYTDMSGSDSVEVVIPTGTAFTILDNFHLSPLQEGDMTVPILAIGISHIDITGAIQYGFAFYRDLANAKLEQQSTPPSID